jgi:hypothetical protein
LAHACAVLVAVVATLGLASQGRADKFQSFPDDRRDAIAAAIANVPDDAGICYDEVGDTESIEIWNLGKLAYVGSFDVTSTLDRIRLGYWISTATRHDGGIFNLRPGQLPNVPRMGDGYYREFFVWPAMDLDAGTYDRTAVLFDSVVFPGPMRILLGVGGEVYFTGDHYGEESPPPGLPAYYVNPTGPCGAAVPESGSFFVVGTLGLLGYGRRQRKRAA